MRDEQAKFVPPAQLLEQPEVNRLEWIVAVLTEDGSVNFDFIVTLLEGIDLESNQKVQLSVLVTNKIIQLIQRGNWHDLRGAKELLSLLNITEFGFAEGVLEKIYDIFINPQFSYTLLLELSPTLFDGKLSNGEVYERIPYTKQIMLKYDITDPSLLSDEFIEWLWAVRELLIMLHSLPLAQQRTLSSSTLLPLLLNSA